MTEWRPQAHFAKYGKIKDATILQDRFTNRSRGFGFITFEEPASVTAVLAAQYHELDGRKVEVKPALPKEYMMDDAALDSEATPEYNAGYGYAPPHGVYAPPRYNEYAGGYVDGQMVMPQPYYYAYGVAPPPMSPTMQPTLSPAMSPMVMHPVPPVPPHGVPVSSAFGEASSFVTLPHSLSYVNTHSSGALAPGAAPSMMHVPMPVYPPPGYPPMAGVPVAHNYGPGYPPPRPASARGNRDAGPSRS